MAHMKKTNRPEVLPRLDAKQMWEALNQVKYWFGLGAVWGVFVCFCFLLGQPFKYTIQFVSKQTDLLGGV